jgi:hypothetical protein
MLSILVKSLSPVILSRRAEGLQRAVSRGDQRKRTPTLFMRGIRS